MHSTAGVQTHMLTLTHNQHIEKSREAMNIILTGTHTSTNSSHKNCKNLSSTAQIHLSSPADTGWSPLADECTPVLFRSSVTLISSGFLNSRSDLNYIQVLRQHPVSHVLWWWCLIHDNVLLSAVYVSCNWVLSYLPLFCSCFLPNILANTCVHIF